MTPSDPAAELPPAIKPVPPFHPSIHLPGSLEMPMVKWAGADPASGQDTLVVEEPLEYRILDQPIATVMRTPGDDRDLALGFFFGEAWISSYKDLGALSLCTSPSKPPGQTMAPSGSNVANLIPSQGTAIDLAGAARLVATSSSCGVCGQRTIEAILRTLPAVFRHPARDLHPLRVSTAILYSLTGRLRQAQPLFGRTGALHAAGIFEARGNLLAAREDIGRHNAVDKVIGLHFREDKLPLEQHILAVSGRASFEIVQKALRAGLRMVVAISGVSSLAVELAKAGGITLCGFLRGQSLTCYSHPERIIH